MGAPQSKIEGCATHGYVQEATANVRDVCDNIKQFRPFGAEHYILPVEAAVVALLSGPTKPDITMDLACKSRCVINYVVCPGLTTWLETIIKPFNRATVFSDETVLERHLTWVYTGKPQADRAKYRKAAWAPDPSAALGGWRLGGEDPGDATSVSKDLLWLMLVCRKISGDWDIPSGCEIGIIKYFSPQKLVGVLDSPASILPLPAGKTTIRLDTSQSVIRKIHHELNLPYSIGLKWIHLSTVLMRDEWWDLYRSSFTDGRSDKIAYLNENPYMETMMAQLYGILPIKYELRILDLISAAVKDIMPPGTMRCMCYYAAIYSRGPALRAALALPDQIYAFRGRVATIMTMRPKLGPELYVLLQVYLRACGPEEMEHGIREILDGDALGSIQNCGYTTRRSELTVSSSILDLYRIVDLLVDATMGLPPILIEYPAINQYNTLLILALAPYAEVRLMGATNIRLLQNTSTPNAEPDGIRLAAQYAVYSGRAPDMRAALRMVKREMEGWAVEGRGTVGSVLGHL